MALASSELYHIKRTDFLGRTNVPIILQNQNGPCPLLAICNVLLLRNWIKIHPTKSEISVEDLLGLVANRLFDTNASDEGRDELYVRNQQQNISDVISLLPRLATGIDVNVKFTSIHGFEFTTETAVFDLLGIRIVHGWLVDPQDDITEKAIGFLSYNKLLEKLVALEQKLPDESETSDPSPAEEIASVELEPNVLADSAPAEGSSRESGVQQSNLEAAMADLSSQAAAQLSLSDPAQEPEAGEAAAAEEAASHENPLTAAQKTEEVSEAAESVPAIEGIIISNFLNSTASQLTYHGLFSLQEGLKERELAVFFRNNHFNTIFKYNGALFLLATDQGYSSQPNLVWEKLSEVEGNSEFYTGDMELFHPNSIPKSWIEDHETALAVAESAGLSAPKRSQSYNPDLQLAMALQQQEYSAQRRVQPGATVHQSFIQGGSGSNDSGMRFVGSNSLPTGGRSRYRVSPEKKPKECNVM